MPYSLFRYVSRSPDSNTAVAMLVTWSRILSDGAVGVPARQTGETPVTPPAYGVTVAILRPPVCPLGAWLRDFT